MGALKTIGPKPKEDVIEFIEDLLRDAKSGELQGIVVVMTMKDRTTGNGWMGIHNNIMAVVGELTVVKVEVMQTYIEMRSD
jgi:hypothetical protein